MRKVTKLALALVAVGSVASAAIDMNFRHTTALRETADSGSTITFDFTVDGSGNVTLDASTTSLLANIINSVNSWDGNVGTVDHSSAYNTTFQIVMSAYADSQANRSFTMDGRYSTGMIGVSGNNASRIDGQTASTPNDMEYVKFTLTSGSPLISLTSFDWDMAGTVATLADAKLLDGNTTKSYIDMVATYTGAPSTYGTQDTSADGFTIGSGAGALLFTSPRSDEVPAGTHGYGLSGVTLNVIPEPATIGMIGFGAIATLLVRRFKNRA
jgi:hypothetical protein